MIPAAPDMVSCERVIELLLEYLEGDLTPELQAAMDKHLASCPPCVEFLRQYEATTDVCRDALRREMPNEVQSHLLEVLRDELQP